MVLFTSQGNDTVDSLAEKLLGKGHMLVRIGEKSKLSERYWDSVGACCLDDNIKAELLAANTSQNKWKEKKREAVKACLIRVSIICGANVKAAEPPGVVDMKYKMVVVEEAAQSQEPPVLCAVNRAHPHDGQRALVGGTQQLPPTCNCKWAEANGLGVSLMKRMREEARVPYTILSQQYRMHPSIRKWPSFYFYGDTLTDGLKALSHTPEEGIKWLQPAGAIAFVNIHNAEEYHSDSKSYSNSTEAVALTAFLAAVLHVQRGSEAIIATDVGITTPYSAQVGLISWYLQNAGVSVQRNGADGVFVGSVDKFQGGERSLMTLSMAPRWHQGSLAPRNFKPNKNSFFFQQKNAQT